MISEAVEWVTERFKRGAEFEIEGTLIRAVAEYAPHTIASAIGCAIIKAQIGLAVSGVVVVCVVIIVKHRRGHHEQSSEAPATQPQSAQIHPADGSMGNGYSLPSTGYEGEAANDATGR